MPGTRCRGPARPPGRRLGSRRFPAVPFERRPQGVPYRLQGGGLGQPEPVGPGRRRPARRTPPRARRRPRRRPRTFRCGPASRSPRPPPGPGRPWPRCWRRGPATRPAPAPWAACGRPAVRRTGPARRSGRAPARTARPPLRCGSSRSRGDCPAPGRKWEAPARGAPVACAPMTLTCASCRAGDPADAEGFARIRHLALPFMLSTPESVAYDLAHAHPDSHYRPLRGRGGRRADRHGTGGPRARQPGAGPGLRQRLRAPGADRARRGLAAGAHRRGAAGRAWARPGCSPGCWTSPANRGLRRTAGLPRRPAPRTSCAWISRTAPCPRCQTPPPGVELRTGADFADDPAPAVRRWTRRRCRTNRATSTSEFTDYEAWLEETWHHPLLSHELTSRRRGRRPPGGVQRGPHRRRHPLRHRDDRHRPRLPRPRPGQARQEPTPCTAPVRPGARRRSPGNDTGNGPMLAINKWFGYADLRDGGEVMSATSAERLASLEVVLVKAGRTKIRYRGANCSPTTAPGSRCAPRGRATGVRDFGFVRFEPGDVFTEYYWRDRWYAVKEVRDAAGVLKGWYCDVTRPGQRLRRGAGGRGSRPGPVGLRRRHGRTAAGRGRVRGERAGGHRSGGGGSRREALDDLERLARGGGFAALLA